MAISLKDKIAYVNKFADKADEKLQKIIKLSVNIESPKLNLTDAQKDKIKSSLQTAFERIKKIEDEKTGTGKKPRQPNLMALTKQIQTKQGITFEQARTKAKQAFAAKKKGQTNAIQSVLQDFKSKVGKLAYSRATKGTDIKRDMERPALKEGKRKVTTQGYTTNKYGTFKNKVGSVYYENRANRIDINQPSKKRYPKLEDGGEFGGGGKMDYSRYNKGGMTMQAIANKYEKNEDENAHSENVVLLAKHFGTAEELKEAKAILKNHNEEGSLSSENGAKRRELSLRLIEKARAQMKKEGVQFGKGGKMARGGQIDEKEKLSNITYQLINTEDSFKKNNPKAYSRMKDEYKVQFIKVYGKDEYEKRHTMADGGMMADGGSIGDNFEEVIDLGSEQYYTRPYGIVESESSGEVELVAVATIKDLEEYMSEDELPEEGNFQLDITLVPTKEFISEQILESANDEDSSSISDDSVVNLVNYAGGLNYSPQERVFFESHQDALDYLMSDELKEQINRDSFSSDYIMYKQYNRLGQRNLEYLDYLMGVTDKFVKGGFVAIKGSNPSTGEKFGVVIGSLEKEDGRTTLIVRSMYSSRIKSYELRFDEKGFLSAIGDFGSSTDGAFPDMNKGRLSVSNVDADNKKESIDAISKITSPSFAKKVYDYVQEEKMAKGGLTEHGLKMGDTITDNMFWEDSIVVKNQKSGTKAQVNLNTGKRKEAKMAKGGYVAVGEKDGYLTIISKPSTKENAQKMLDLGSLPRGEMGKVVTVEEAKAHKKVIGREYLAYGGKMKYSRKK